MPAQATIAKETGIVHTLHNRFAAEPSELNENRKAKLWHDAIQPYYRRFRQITESLDVTMAEPDMAKLKIELEVIQEIIENTAYPARVFPVRWHLLNAVLDTMAATAEALAHNPATAHAYLKAAEIELGFYSQEQRRLGLS